MRLIDKPLSRQEIENDKDMLQGNLVRILMGDSAREIVNHLGFAVDRLNMIAMSRILELEQREEDGGKE